MITQVYTAQTAAEAAQLSQLGVKHVGVTVSERGLPGEIGAPAGKEIVESLAGGPAKCVALTVESDLEEIRRFADELRPDILHLCGDTDLVGPGMVADLRAWIRRSGLRTELMQAVAVTGPETIDVARSFEPHVDWVILDSVSETVEGIGAAGVVHDWKVSREIVAATEVPVILAGGLGPDNVADAVAAVHPAGVDSLTRTNRYSEDGSFVKDLEAVARFVAEAERVAAG